MGGRSGQGVGKGMGNSSGTGKSGMLKNLAELKKQKQQLLSQKQKIERRSNELASKDNMTQADNDEAAKLYEDFKNNINQQKEIDQKIAEQEARIAETANGTKGNEFTEANLKQGNYGLLEFTGKLNPTAQTNYQIAQSDLDYLKNDKQAGIGTGGFDAKSGYYFTSDSWQNSYDTQKAFDDTGLPKTPENMAVLYYTADSKVNSGYYEGKTPSPQDEKYKEILNKSLEKYGNNFKGTTFRGVKDQYAQDLWNQVQGNVGGKISFDSFQSSAYDEKKAFGGQVIIVTKTQGKQGHLLDKFSHYQGEKEVLYKAGSKFNITGYEEKNGKKYIYLED